MSDRDGQDVEKGPDPLALLRFVWSRAGRWISLAAGLLIAGLASLAAFHRSEVQWGDVPTWVLAVTSLLALLAALFAGLVAYSVLDIELGRDLVSSQERLAEQANKVAAWYSSWESAPFPGTLRRGLQARGALIKNASDLPVYQLRVSFCVPVPDDADWRGGVLYRSPVMRDVAPPGEMTFEIPEDIRELGEAAAGADQGWRGWRVALEFTDTAGSRWLRDSRGRLGPADDPEAGFAGPGS